MAKQNGKAPEKSQSRSPSDKGAPGNSGSHSRQQLALQSLASQAPANQSPATATTTGPPSPIQSAPSARASRSSAPRQCANCGKTDERKSSWHANKDAPGFLCHACYQWARAYPAKGPRPPEMWNKRKIKRRNLKKARAANDQSLFPGQSQFPVHKVPDARPTVEQEVPSERAAGREAPPINQPAAAAVAVAQQPAAGSIAPSTARSSNLRRFQTLRFGLDESSSAGARIESSMARQQADDDDDDQEAVNRRLADELVAVQATPRTAPLLPTQPPPSRNARAVHDAPFAVSELPTALFHGPATHHDALSNASAPNTLHGPAIHHDALSNNSSALSFPSSPWPALADQNLPYLDPGAAILPLALVAISLPLRERGVLMPADQQQRWYQAAEEKEDNGWGLYGDDDGDEEMEGKEEEGMECEYPDPDEEMGGY